MTATSNPAAPDAPDAPIPSTPLTPPAPPAPSSGRRFLRRVSGRIFLGALIAVGAVVAALVRTDTPTSADPLVHEAEQLATPARRLTSNLRGRWMEHRIAASPDSTAPGEEGVLRTMLVESLAEEEALGTIFGEYAEGTPARLIFRGEDGGDHVVVLIRARGDGGTVLIEDASWTPHTDYVYAPDRPHPGDFSLAFPVSPRSDPNASPKAGERP